MMMMVHAPVENGRRDDLPPSESIAIRCVRWFGDRGREREISEERGTKGAANETEAENSALLNQAWRVYNGHCINKSSYTGPVFHLGHHIG
jgi:hypothetical protein